MTPQERQIIESLFARLRQVEQQAPARAGEAERFINDRLQAQPGAAYYLAQTVVAQERALEAAQARITELERDVYSRGGGGFLSGVLGGRGHSYRSSPHQSYRAGPWAGTGRAYGYGSGLRSQPPGGGFLAGAAQTAMGVAGGFLIANLIASAFGGNEAAAAPKEYEPGVAPGEDTGAAGSEVGGDQYSAGEANFSDFGDLSEF